MSRTSNTAGKLLLLTLLTGFLFEAEAQKIVSKNPANLAQLRTRFTAAVRDHFEVVRDELKARSITQGGETYWLVHVQPKHSGYFKLTYRYNYNDSHYSHVERDFGLRIGPRGCRRGPPYTGSYSRFCVGDTIIVPIMIQNYTEHDFKLTADTYSKEDDTSFDKEYPAETNGNLGCSEVSNAVAEYMSYLGCESHKLLHRNGGYTLETYAEFEAKRPGRFNLAVGTTGMASPAGASVNVPITIVERGVPVTLLASHQEVRGYSRGFDGSEYVSSTSGDGFMSEVMILQPGDRISLKYSTSVRSASYERSERVEEAPKPPAIFKLPFVVKADYDFSDWLLDYLPK
jgi:hypothetical protein